MMDCSSPWLVNLVATTKDNKNVFMLLEAVMGGELFAYLQVNVEPGILSRFQKRLITSYYAPHSGRLIPACDIMGWSGSSKTEQAGYA